MQHIAKWSLVSLLSLGIASLGMAQTKYLHFDGSGKEFVPRGNTIAAITAELSQDQIVREYAYMYLDDTKSILMFIPLTDSLLHGMAQTKEGFLKAMSSFDFQEYLGGYKLETLLDAAIKNGRMGKTPITDAYWALHFPVRPDSNVAGNQGGLKTMTLTYTSLRLSVTFLNGALYSYTRI